MKTILLAAAATFSATSLRAQPVPRAVVVEHFTNTYCSVCAARNPGFYAALRMKPEVLHVAYHPSSPYPACPLNQHNPVGNDSRTHYYNVYGSTPRLVINGTALQASANYGDTAIYTPFLGKTSAFEMRASFERVSQTNLSARVVIYKRAVSPLNALELYCDVVEDTLQFIANNGETSHYDVFRKAVPDGDAVVVGLLNVGDSTVRTYSIVMDPAWNPSRLSYLVMLQEIFQAGATMHQATRVELGESTLGVDGAALGTAMAVSPNPAGDVLRASGLTSSGNELTVMDVMGRIVLRTSAEGEEVNLDVRGLLPGTYFLRLASSKGGKTLRFVKQ